MSGKGYLYTLEVLIAISILFVVLIYLYRSPIGTPRSMESLMVRQGISALEYVDKNQDLRKWVNQTDEGPLEVALSGLLPGELGYESEICTDVCTRRNVPNDKSVLVVDYYISTYETSYTGKRVRLYLWGTS